MENLQEISDYLKNIGFTSNESKVYLTLLKKGSSLAGEIAKQTNLDRTSVYNALDLLLKKGIISFVIESNKRIFQASNPEKIIEYHKEQQEIAKQILPYLKKIQNTKKQKSKISLYQNITGLKTIFNDILKSCNQEEEYLVIGSEGQFSDKMPYFSPIFRKQKQKNKIKTRLITRKDLKTKEKNKYTEYRKIPSKIKSPTTINIYKNKVVIFIWDDKPEAVLIENKNVAETFKNYFEFIWKHARG